MLKKIVTFLLVFFINNYMSTKINTANNWNFAPSMRCCHYLLRNLTGERPLHTCVRSVLGTRFLAWSEAFRCNFQALIFGENLPS